MAYDNEEMMQAAPEQVIGLERQRALAAALLKQSMDSPQGEMIGNRFVAPSGYQYMANLANQLVGSNMAKDAEEKQSQLAAKLRQQQADNLQKGLSQLYGTGDTKADRRAALATFLSPEGGASSRALGGKIADLEFAEPKTHNVGPGGTLVTADGKVLYQAPFKMGGAGGAGGGGVAGGGMLDGGRFNKRGDFVTNTGAEIAKSEITKDRELMRAANELRQGIASIKPEDVQKANIPLLGDVSEGGIKGYLAKQVGYGDAVSAQAKINASAIRQTLNNLPPGPASDKDISTAKSTFPGYGDAKALNEWMVNTNALLEQKINATNDKYGTDKWYGAKGIAGNPQGAAPGAPGAPGASGNKTVVREGAVLSGPNKGKTIVQYSDGTTGYR